MSVHLHIGHLVLVGLALEAADGPIVQAAAEAELTRLLTEEGIAAGLRQGGALESARGGEVQLGAVRDPDALGRQIGGALHRSLLR